MTQDAMIVAAGHATKEQTAQDQRSKSKRLVGISAQILMIIIISYLLSSLTDALSLPSTEDRNEMEKLRSWQTPRSIATV